MYIIFVTKVTIISIEVRWWWWDLHSSQQCRGWRYWVKHRGSRGWRNRHHWRSHSWSYQGHRRRWNLANGWFLVLKSKLEEELLRVLVPMRPEFTLSFFYFSAGNLRTYSTKD